MLPASIVGAMGDGPIYGQVCALRAVASTDGMTADGFPFDRAYLDCVASLIVNEMRGINPVAWDIASKPPGISRLECRKRSALIATDRAGVARSVGRHDCGEASLLT